MTRTGEYALRALIFLAQQGGGEPIPGREIARRVGIPAKYLQKILGDLTRVGVLTSSPGRTGGFKLRRKADRLSLFEVLSPFERFETSRCPFGNAVCSDRNPCSAHHGWKKVVETERQFLQQVTIADVATPARSRHRLKKP